MFSINILNLKKYCPILYLLLQRQGPWELGPSSLSHPLELDQQIFDFGVREFQGEDYI